MNSTPTWTHARRHVHARSHKYAHVFMDTSIFLHVVLFLPCNQPHTLTHECIRTHTSSQLNKYVNKFSTHTHTHILALKSSYWPSCMWVRAMQSCIDFFWLCVWLSATVVKRLVTNRTASKLEQRHTRTYTFTDLTLC